MRYLHRYHGVAPPMALIALLARGDSVHVPVHADGGHCHMIVTQRSDRYRPGNQADAGGCSPGAGSVRSTAAIA
jgi:hypothetical protein